MESQNCSTTKSSRGSWDNGKSDKKNVETNTEFKTCSCHNCLQLKLLDANILNHMEPVNQQTIVNYKKAINYINSCHAIINEYLAKTNNQRCLKCNSKCEDTVNVNMPDLPDFIMLLSSLTTLNKEGLCSKCFHGDCTSHSRSEEDSLKRNKKSPSRPRTASSICRKSESPEKIYNSSRSTESPETTRSYDKKKTHSSHCTSRKSNRDTATFNKEDKHPQTVEDSGCCLPNSKKSSTILTISTDEAKIHTKSAQISRKLTARTIHSVSATDESDNERNVTVSTTMIGNSITGKNITKKKNKCKGKNFEMGDASTDFESIIQKNSPGTEAIAASNNSKPHQGNGREHDDNIQALYAIIGQQLLQGNQMMPVQKVIDILKNQAFSPLTISESQKDNSTRESASNTETCQDTSTDTIAKNVVQCHENIGHCLNRHRIYNKDKEHALPPPLVSQRDIENYTTELMETLRGNSSQENTPRYTNTESTTQSFDLEEDYCTSDKRDESRKMSQTRIPTAVRSQIKRSSNHHSPARPLINQTSQHKFSSNSNENCISCVKEAQNLVSSSSNEYQVATSDDQRECSDCGNVILNTQGAMQQQQPFFYSVQRTVETNSPMLQQDLPPYVVQQKRSDHFVCNRQRRREKGRNPHCGSPRSLDQHQSYYEQNMSSIENIPEEGEYVFEEEENTGQNENSTFKKMKQQPEKEKCSTVSMRSRTDSSEIETDKDEIIKQFTPRKIIIDSNGATTKMKCMHK